MTANNPFSNTRPDLGVGDLYGYSRESASDNLLRSAYSTASTCYVCSNKPDYRLVAKSEQYNTAQLQSGLYICKHCISLGHISTKIYGIKKLD